MCHIFALSLLVSGSTLPRNAYFSWQTQNCQIVPALPSHRESVLSFSGILEGEVGGTERGGHAQACVRPWFSALRTHICEPPTKALLLRSWKFTEPKKSFATLCNLNQKRRGHDQRHPPCTSLHGAFLQPQTSTFQSSIHPSAMLARYF